MTTPIIGDIMSLLKWIWEIIVVGVDRIWQYMVLIFQLFPPDNSKRTMLMAGIYVSVMIILLVIVSPGNVLIDGVDLSGDKTVTVDPFQGEDPSLGTGEEGGGETPPENETLPTGECNTNDDCTTTREGQTITTFCCQEDRYSGFTCSGRCLSTDSYSSEYCKHPNTCRDITETKWFAEFANDDINRCDTKRGVEESSRFCKNIGSNTVGQQNTRATCCLNVIAPCYGYCLIAEPYDCWDINSCMYEGMRRPIIQEVSEVTL